MERTDFFLAWYTKLSTVIKLDGNKVTFCKVWQMDKRKNPPFLSLPVSYPPFLWVCFLLVI